MIVNHVFEVPSRLTIGHFTGVCLVTWLLNASEAGVDLALIQTRSLCFFMQMSTGLHNNNLIYTTKAGRSTSKQGLIYLLQFNGVSLPYSLSDNCKVVLREGTTPNLPIVLV